jgi:iron(III) transport system ATP-binding protein
VPAAAGLTLEGVSARYGAKVALAKVSLAVASGEILGLLGPSGSGKSTLLRLIAGVDRPSGGRILIDDLEMSGPEAFVEPEKRRVGMVFQDYALFPHLTVAANVAFGLHDRRQTDTTRTVSTMLERVGLGQRAQSYPHMLSGGERQRVALARALAPQPRILLMDEPFSSLDSRLREEVRRHTLDLLRETRTTTIIVTHDPDEAMRIADRVALLQSGELIQCATPEELYLQPATLLAARCFDMVAELQGHCRDGRVDTPLGSFSAPRIASGSQATVCLRPRHLSLAADTGGIPAHVVSTGFRGDSDEVFVKVAGLAQPIRLRTGRRDSRLAPGAIVHLTVHADGAPVFAFAPPTE